MRKLCPSQFCNPTAEPFHGFHNNRSGSDEQETTELCCQQDQELRPLPAVQRIKSTASKPETHSPAQEGVEELLP